ncbi:MAG: tRNA-dihydrouridine synthase [Candidatus Bathyarchaeota archaeon]|nr:tRNA-dihydrouridine synthase [Candidatus Bathyarchaeota archaeon]
MAHAGFAGRIRAERLLLPPLADYTDYPYRRIMAGFNPPFVITEMISASAVVHGGEKTRRMLAKTEGVPCEGVQLVGSDPSQMAVAAKVVEELGFDYVDINMGCTINKVARQGAGISLMGDEEKAQSVASAVIDAVSIPVTCKMRLGLSRGALNAVSLSRKLEDIGVAAVTVHGRSGEKKWGMPVDFEELRRVVDALAIPVVGNGGVFTGKDALEMVEKTGAAAVMPGRGIVGNPWLVPEILSAFSGSNYTPPTLQAKKETCLLHMRYLSEYYGEKGAAVRMRRILPEYFTGCQNLRTLRQDIHETSTPGEVAARLDKIGEDGLCGFYDNW